MAPRFTRIVRSLAISGLGTVDHQSRGPDRPATCSAQQDQSRRQAIASAGGARGGHSGRLRVRADGSFGFAANIIIPTSNGPRQYPLRTATERQTIDYIEAEWRGEGAIKNIIWDPVAGELRPGALMPRRKDSPDNKAMGPATQN